MQSSMLMTMGIAVGLLVGFSVRGPQPRTRNESQIVDAAFRDGMFQAKLDVESGRKPHVASGRWNTNADRALFIAGYQQGYREVFEAHAGKLPKPAVAEVTGYWDGLLDGAAHRTGSQPFQAEKTDNYVSGGQGLSGLHDDAGKYQRDYRHAYLNGYQQGYYASDAASTWSYYSQGREKAAKPGSEPSTSSDQGPTNK
jgi:hypothetical protein